MRSHILHFAVETVFQPILKVIFGLVMVGVADADLLKPYIHTPLLNQAS